MAITLNGSSITLSDGSTLQNGYGGSADTYNVVRAWASFDGTSGGRFQWKNVSSVTYMAVGTYQILIDSAARPSAGFGFFAMVCENTGATDAASACWSSGSEQGVAAQTLVTEDADGAYKNYPVVQYVLWR